MELQGDKGLCMLSYYKSLYPSGPAARERGYGVEEIKIDGKKYSLVSDHCSCWYNNGYNEGIITPSCSLLCCKSREIAEHMSRYFAKEIFEATFAQYIGLYEWL